MGRKGWADAMGVSVSVAADAPAQPSPTAPVIELGELSYRAQLPAAAPHTGGLLARFSGRRPHPSVMLVLLVLLPMLCATGSIAPPSPLAETRIPANADDSMFVVDDRLYVISPAVGGDSRTASAYRLPDGARLWHTTGTMAGGNVSLLSHLAGTVLIPTYSGSAAERMVVLDAASGRRLWSRPGLWVGTAGSLNGDPRVLLAESRDDNGLDSVEAVDLSTGEVSWRHGFSSQASFQLSGDWYERKGIASRIVVGLPSGRVEVWDAVTGLLRVAATLRTPILRDADQLDNWLVAVGDLILVRGADEMLTAYGLERLDRRWSVPWPGGVGGWYQVGGCANGLFCLQTSPGLFRALDPDTGQVRWEQKWAYLQPIGSMLLGFGEGRIPGNAAPVFLVDPVTGRKRVDLGIWDVAQQLSEADSVSLTRVVPASGKTWLGLLQPGESSVRLLGAEPGVMGCWAGPRSVVCRRPDFSIGIWRY